MASVYNKPKKLRLLLQRQNGKCWLCGQPMAKNTITFDHVIPKSAGGTSEIDNLKLAHERCNKLRGNSLEQALVERDGIIALRWNVG